MKLFVCILLGFLFFLNNGKAQDIHFSQHFHAHNYVNPSFNGLSPGMSRFSLNTKNQWYAVRSPFTTYLASFDNSWRRKYSGTSYFTTAALLYYDVAGDANFSTLQFSPSFAYTFLTNSKINSLLSFGIQPTIAQRSVDISKLTFDNQFDGYQFNSNAPTNEFVDYQTFVFADVGAGVHYIHFLDKNTYAGGGLFVSHLNKPVVSMKNNDKVRLSRKLVLHGEARMYFQNTIFLPSLYFAMQGKHTEWIVGGRAILNRVRFTAVENNILFRKNFLLGLYYRGKDALIVYSGLEFQNYNVGVSYDFNVSRLLPASNMRGGVEISAAYIWKKPKKHRNKDIPCPIF